MKKIKNINLKALALLSLMPSFVFASSNSNASLVFQAIVAEAFLSIFSSVLFLYPLARLYPFKGDASKTFKTLFIIRVCILLFFDIFITPSILFFDFISIFVGGFIIIPISAFTERKKEIIANATDNKLLCESCKSEILPEDLFCPNCGMKIEKQSTTKSNIVKPSDFDPIYSKTEDEILETVIKQEMSKSKIDINSELIPKNALKRKNIMFIILSLLTFLFLSMIFFHVGFIFWIIAIIIIFIFYKKSKSYDLIKFLKREIKSRPGEEISNIVMNVKLSFVKDNSKNVLLIGLILSVFLTSVVYFNPHILYETTGDGYTVRFYTIGLTNITSVKIPEKHNEKNVVGVRGQVFKNMYMLRSVALPDTITEIRGQAFENDILLNKINIPSNLVYLGGSAFKNCKNLKEITLPNSLTTLGGETFKNAVSLEKVTLSNNLKEIRGNTFENAKKLKEITIPDTITRIGGHAFYGCTSLRSVKLTENSKLEEIGSSAFRLCDSLEEITLPENTDVNYRAFKESPTKVKRFGEADYGNLVDKNKHKYNSYLSLDVGETKNVISYKRDSAILSNDATLTLENINITKSGNEFTLIYKDNSGEKKFKMNKTISSYEINDYLEVEFTSKYALTSSSYISLDVYFD